MTETKEQRECPYCHEPYRSLLEFRIKGANKDVFAPNINSFDGISTDIELVKRLQPYGSFRKLEYCPMCGRKLVRDEN
ncbi:hypothetical protein [Furfurilactobacillus milii]|uniref:Uncharacterized protein n=1 Tax=Furfurilactobacillus milii TaxID=2888272 RepID=A0ABT6DEB0_9LACO|nr:hypothetical protein [Furfurilactobacillus milii]QLE67433.1 hypothetical protein LROSL2_2083 [Furfurilactobacillus rossiae]MCF6161888.1 hypothetical protein [Furfurilactobacillus milii]MCF6164268.1 hypothetical protein [Furfurilactobacillus milii]MDF9914893.1 hypothetical protein [Furfurilactobacillus milii]QLE69862.1 hypothetical protein LROSL3_2141 [Furfurilactobacillus rossiae]